MVVQAEKEVTTEGTWTGHRLSVATWMLLRCLKVSEVFSGTWGFAFHMLW